METQNTVKILFLGENWLGSSARACCEALRRLDCDVVELDDQTIFPQWRAPLLKSVRRVARPIIVREYNEQLLGLANQFRPDILFAFKGPFLQAETLRTLRCNGVRCVNFYPDTSAFAHGPLIPAALPEYDCVFYTKRFWLRDVEVRLRLRSAVYLPHGYDPTLHRIPHLNSRDLELFATDVSYVGSHTQYKEEVLTGLVRVLPNLRLSIWGSRWQSARNNAVLRPHIRGYPVHGTPYPKAIRAAKIALAIQSGRVEGASQGDETSTRTFQIPACGGFMLHERTPEVLSFYDEGVEIACFGSVPEMAERIEYYLQDESSRRQMVDAAYFRCVPAYSYDNRMMEVLPRRGNLWVVWPRLAL